MKDQPVIVEGFVEFAYEITLLTVRHVDGVTVCPPVGHVQEDGDYRESWQPAPMSAIALEPGDRRWREPWSRRSAGSGVFGVELFVTADDEVLFSEVSPRPHDTGMVTMISQPTSEFALHVRAILGLPVRADDVAVPVRAPLPSSSGPRRARPSYDGMATALAVPTAQVRIFGKPTSHPGRRLGVALAQGDTVDRARSRAREAAAAIVVRVR